MANPAADETDVSALHSDHLVELVLHLLSGRVDRDAARDSLDRRLGKLLNASGLLGAFVFVFDWEVDNYVLVHSRSSMPDRGELRRSIQRLVRRLHEAAPNSTLSDTDPEGPALPLGVTARRLDRADTSVGAIALLGANANAVLHDSNELLGELTGFLLAYQHAVRVQELERGQRELVTTKARLELVLRELEQRSVTIENMNQELLRFRAHARRVATLGELVAGVAHEINNPLAYVLTSLDFIKEQLAKIRPFQQPHDLETTSERENFAEILDAAADATDGAHRIRDIARDLRSLSRAGDSSNSVVDLNNAIASAVRVTAPQVRPNADVTCDLCDDARVCANAGQLSQVIANLLINAAQAIGTADADRRGTIAIKSRNANGQVMITVRDNGPGIAPHLVKQVLDPFFTTKPEGQGTGLGLSISCEIVRRFGGELTLHSEVGVGTTFYIELPSAAVEHESTSPAGQPTENSAPAPVIRPRRARLLFIDDESAMLRSYAQHFGAHHYVVLANGITRALEILERDRDFELIVCDVSLGRISPVRPWAALSSRWPELIAKSIFVTASVEHEPLQELQELGRPVLEKPFDLSRIDELLLANQHLAA